MRTGVSTAALFLRYNNEDALPLLDGLGVKTAEVFLTSYSEYGKEFAELLRTRKGGVDVHSVHVLNVQFEPQLFSRHERVKADAFEMLDRAMTGAETLGASYYTFHGLARMKRAARSGENDDFSAWGNRLAEISSVCEKHGVRLCLENVEWATYNRPSVFSGLKKYCPALGGVLDVKQAHISGYACDRYIEEMGANLTHVHLTDRTAHGKPCLPGKGTLDFCELLKRLADVGFDGPLILEPYADGYGEVGELREACDYLDELLYKMNLNEK